jgi:hypothetical protein
MASPNAHFMGQLLEQFPGKLMVRKAIVKEFTADAIEINKSEPYRSS